MFVRQDARLRITPACAGKSITHGWNMAFWRDHPRVCGEKAPFALKDTSTAGSPPRVRGKDTVIKFPGDSPRITPACAGKSILPRGEIRWQKDHPRVCGEKLLSANPCWEESGSPPRVRGKGVDHGADTNWKGITPACAGKSSLLQDRQPERWDHPRVCGEKDWAKAAADGVSGSPPRVRGKGRTSRGISSLIRITPACAGKSDDSDKHRRNRGDHPRVCGEK